MIYKAENKTEICDETVRWVSLLNGFNGKKTSPVPFEKANRSPVKLTNSSPAPSPPPLYGDYPYSSWSRADEPLFGKREANAKGLSVNAKEFFVKSNKAARLRSPVHQNSWNPTSYELQHGSSFLTSPAFLDSWLNYGEFNYKESGFSASQLPIMA